MNDAGDVNAPDTPVSSDLWLTYRYGVPAADFAEAVHHTLHEADVERIIKSEIRVREYAAEYEAAKISQSLAAAAAAEVEAAGVLDESPDEYDEDGLPLSECSSTWCSGTQLQSAGVILGHASKGNSVTSARIWQEACSLHGVGYAYIAVNSSIVPISCAEIDIAHAPRQEGSTKEGARVCVRAGGAERV